MIGLRILFFDDFMQKGVNKEAPLRIITLKYEFVHQSRILEGVGELRPFKVPASQILIINLPFHGFSFRDPGSGIDVA